MKCAGGQLRACVAGLGCAAMTTMAAAAPGTTVTLDFNQLQAEVHGGEGNFADGALVMDGFVLDPGEVDWTPGAQSWIGHYQIASDVGSYNGTNYFVFDYFRDHSSLNVYGEHGTVFGVRSLDLAEANVTLSSTCTAGVLPALRPFACGVTFIGYAGDQLVATWSTMLDGVHDGTGPEVDFQTFIFDDRFSHLTRFAIRGVDILNPALDNLMLTTPVPEPASPALWVAGLAAAGFGARRSAKRGASACSRSQ